MKSVIICCWLMACALLFAQETRQCTQEDAMRADEGSTSLRNWSEVYKAFKQFGQCDQASIAEGYSDSIAQLLSQRWDTIDLLNRLTLHDKSFKQFVLRHVDELMTPDQANAIQKNAESHCPSDAKRLCKSIDARIGALPTQ